MQLNKRIEKLERAIGVTGECRACGGRGKGRIAMAVNGADLVPHDPPGCPACGKGHVWRRLIINGSDAEGMRTRCALARCATPHVS